MRVLQAVGVAALWASAGCASVDTTPAYDRAVHEIRSATGVRQVYHPKIQDELEEREAQLVAQGLELREAVELGLLRNPFLQASFRSIGLAKADHVQAGLLTNPSLSVALRFPVDGGLVQVEGGLLASLVDVWQIPDRKRAAERALERSVLEIAHLAVQLAGSIRAAYIDALAAERLLVVAQENRDLAQHLVELVAERVEAAAATAIDRSLVDLELFDAEVVLRDATLDASEKRRMLVTLLGYDHLAPALRLNGALPGSADALVDGEALCTLARERRLDLRAARARVTQAAAELQLQHGLAVKVFSGGINVERDDDWALGPAIRLEVPIFDQNQAQIAKAVEALAQHEALLRSTEMSAVQEVASALARTQAQWDVARVYEDQVSRTLEALELSRQSFEVGKTTILPVIEAQRKLLSARRMHAVRLQAAAAAVSDLERATGAPREELLRADASNDRNQP